MALVFTLAMLLSALLLFIVEPMFARMALPLLGGSPAVWNTAVLFYQVALLGGYAYAHALTHWLGARRQAWLHIALLLAPFVVLPIAIPAGWAPPTGSNPVLWFLGMMLLRVGLPFFVLSTTSPLLQKWFASTSHKAAADPYFLYAASNAGSLVGLLAYPLLIEPNLPLALQARTWTVGYAGLAVLLVACAILLWLRPAANPAPAADAAPRVEKLSVGRRLRWVLLAFIPSSLMLSVTSFLTTNLTPFPLLWVIPLAIYLLSFVIVYMTRPLIPHRFVQRLFPWVLTPLVIAVALLPTQLVWGLVPLHLLGLFVVSLACHGELAADRPSPALLTEFYLWSSVGGALGGIFNGLLAPLLFTDIAEYPLGLVLAAVFGAGALSVPKRRRDRVLSLVGPLAVGLITGGLALAVALRFTGNASHIVVALLVCGLPGVYCIVHRRRPIRYGLGTAAILVLGSLFYRQPGVLHAERNFFGVVRVVLDEENGTHRLLHGDTLHGLQSLAPDRACEPLSYYHTQGPIGQVFAQVKADPSIRRVAVVGLGAGCLAGYATPTQQWTYYEIDPAVERIARDGRYFTFLTNCAAQSRVVLGDARLSLAKEPAGAFDLIVLDAYSSDSVPVHLITREAMALYMDKLAPGGLLAFHISNRYLDLQSVLGNLAQDARLEALVRYDSELPQDERALKTPSRWVLMARDGKSFGAIGGDQRWLFLTPAPSQRLWTDDYSSIFSVIHWR